MARRLTPHAFRTTLLAWFRRHKRDFPWRRTSDPYAILVSEVMLQQTQTARVAERLPRWLEQFPDISTLAAAPPSDVLREWSGLGYNRRALSLQRLAQVVVREHAGVLPRDDAALRALPGVGPYTAAAVRAFAHNLPSTAVDVNVLRVFQRLFRPEKTTTARDVESLLQPLVTRTNARALHAALMDFGATICTAVPKCAVCPFQASCPSAFRVQPLARIARKAAAADVRAHPRRIYRGRLLKTLVKQGPLSLAKLGPHVLPTYGAGDRAWLEGIVRDLEREGFITLRRGRAALA